MQADNDSSRDPHQAPSSNGSAGTEKVERATDAPVPVNLRRADTEVTGADPEKKPTAATGTDATIKGTPNESADYKSGQGLKDDA